MPEDVLIHPLIIRFSTQNLLDCMRDQEFHRMTGGTKENLYKINVSEVDKRSKTDFLNRESSGSLFEEASCMRNVGGVRLPLKVGVAKFPSLFYYLSFFFIYACICAHACHYVCGRSRVVRGCVHVH